MENEIDVKDILNLKNDDDGLFFIYWFIWVMCNEMVWNFLEYEIIECVCLDMEMFELYFFFLLVLCVL